MTLKVAIVGAPSSGKSTMARSLAERHGTLWVPEYLRDFVDAEGRLPVDADQYPIAAAQLAREEQALADPRVGAWLFCDTTPLMTAVYSRHYFGAIDAQLAPLADAHRQRYDLTLVAAPDIPWRGDGQRDSQRVSRVIAGLLAQELARRGIPWFPVSGSREQRMAQAARLLGGATG
jgi:nicotinamide riboside kinase